MNGDLCETAGYGPLAVAVFRLAIADAWRHDPRGQRARAFLAGEGTFRIWCGWIGCDPDVLAAALAPDLAAVEASQRQTARTFGVGETTIRRALGKATAPSGALPLESDENAEQNNADDQATAPNGAPAPWFDEDPADVGASE